MSASYEEVRITFPTSAIHAHPSLQRELDALESESEDLEILQAQGGALTAVMRYDTSIDHPDLLDQLEATHVPYDVYYRTDDAESVSDIAWYRPRAIPDHGRYLVDSDDTPVIPWSTLTDLAHDSVGLTLPRIRAAAHLPPTTIEECATPSSASHVPAPIPYRAIAEQYLEEIGEVWDHETIRNTFLALRASEDVLTLASRLEDIAYATTRVFARSLSNPTLGLAITQARCLARAYDDAEAHLVIYTPTQIIHTQTWPTVGRLHVWRDIVDTIWGSLKAFTQTHSIP
jgi:hypothetical protein